MKSEIYQAHISPLMLEIIDICKQNQIAFVASFSVPSASQPGLECVSALLEQECNPPAHLLQVLHLIRGNLFSLPTRVVAIDRTLTH